jgi:hypothetical protein
MERKLGRPDLRRNNTKTDIKEFYGRHYTSLRSE